MTWYKFKVTSIDINLQVSKVFIRIMVEKIGGHRYLKA